MAPWFIRSTSAREAASSSSKWIPIPGAPAGSFGCRTQRTVARPFITRTPPAICTSNRSRVPTAWGWRERMNIPPGLRFVAYSSTKVSTLAC